MEHILTYLNDISALFVKTVWALFWQSSLLVLVVAAVCSIFRKTSPNFRCILWLLVLIRLILPPGITLPSSIAFWGQKIPKAEKIFVVPSAFEYKTENIAANQESMYPVVNRDVKPKIIWQSIVFMLWGAACGIFVIILFHRLITFSKSLKKEYPIPDDIKEMFAKYAQALEIKTKFRFIISDIPGTPIVTGFKTPKVIIPSAIVNDMSREELASVIVHELAHIKRGDWLINWFQIFISILYFFHPLLWYTNKQIRIEREKACDDLVLLVLGIERKEYAGNLIKILEKMTKRLAFQTNFIGMAEPNSDIGKRVVRIMDKTLRPVKKISVISILIIIIFSLCFMTIASQQSGKNTSAENSKSATSASSESKNESGMPFDKFYAQLDTETKNALNKKVTMFFKNMRLPQIIKAISSQTGITINILDSSDRIDLMFKDTPAVEVLQYINLKFELMYEKSGDGIIIYFAKNNPSENSATNKEEKNGDKKDRQNKENIDGFLYHLDSETRDKLRKEVSLIFTDANISEVLKGISDQTGIEFELQGSDYKMAINCEGHSASYILRLFSKLYDFEYENKNKNIIVKNPYSQPPVISANDSLEIRNKAFDEERMSQESNEFLFEKYKNHKQKHFSLFLESLSPENKEKLSRRIDLMLRQAPVDTILQSIGAQTGLTFVLKGPNSRINTLYRNIPAVDVLELFSRVYNFKYDIPDLSTKNSESFIVVTNPKEIPYQGDGPSANNSSPIELTIPGAVPLTEEERAQKISEHELKIKELMDKKNNKENSTGVSASASMSPTGDSQTDAKTNNGIKFSYEERNQIVHEIMEKYLNKSVTEGELFTKYGTPSIAQYVSDKNPELKYELRDKENINGSRITLVLNKSRDKLINVIVENYVLEPAVITISFSETYIKDFIDKLPEDMKPQKNPEITIIPGCKQEKVNTVSYTYFIDPGTGTVKPGEKYIRQFAEGSQDLMLLVYRIPKSNSKNGITYSPIHEEAIKKNIELKKFDKLTINF